MLWGVFLVAGRSLACVVDACHGDKVLSEHVNVVSMQCRTVVSTSKASKIATLRDRSGFKTSLTNVTFSNCNRGLVPCYGHACTCMLHACTCKWLVHWLAGVLVGCLIQFVVGISIVLPVPVRR